LWKINDFVGDIKQNLEDVKLVETFIAGHEPGNLPLKKDSNAANMIRYHYENYLLRTTKLKDLYYMGAYETADQSGKALQKSFSAHNGSVRHKDLALLSVPYTYELTHQNTIDEFRFEAAKTGLQRELIQKFTAQTSAYIIAL